MKCRKNSAESRINGPLTVKYRAPVFFKKIARNRGDPPLTVFFVKSKLIDRIYQQARRQVSR